MNNAVNYVGEDKTVIVTQKVNGKKVLIEVTDHGDGIPPENLNTSGIVTTRLTRSISVALSARDSACQ